MTKRMEIKFQLVAYTDAAGKFTPGAYLNGNEDNFYIDDDLRDEVACSVKSGETKILSDEGMIMVVADGMGGMNAGEVASDIAVQTVREFFTSRKITSELSSSFEKRRDYLEKAIKECDKRIKEDARKNPDHEGMGSTIIIAWIANGEATISWLGDSRAYRYNPASGLELLSKDHSYVQELVDKGAITYDQSFDHPQGNIVLRSLGDSSSKPKPESRNFTVSENDLFILCSDGLSGVLRDRKSTDPITGLPYPEENIEDIVVENFDDINRCREALFEAAERGEWYDNVTAVLCKILSVEDSNPQSTDDSPKKIANADCAINKGSIEGGGESGDNVKPDSSDNTGSKLNKSLHIRISRSSIVYIVVGILIIIAAIVGAISFLQKSNPQNNTTPAEKTIDNITVEKKDTIPSEETKADSTAKNIDPSEMENQGKEKSNRVDPLKIKENLNNTKEENDSKRLKAIPHSEQSGLTPSEDPDSIPQ